MNAKPAHILVAEDDKSVRLVVQQALARQGYTVQSSGTAAGLWKLIEAGRGDVLISDIGLPDGDALDLLPRIQQKRPDMPVIVMSARSTLLTAVKAQQTGVFEYLPKPFELRSLVEATSRAVGSIGQSRPAAGTPSAFEEGGPLVGRSPPMQDIFKAMAR
ncbi:MAG: response regulator, partial [Candidatus Puniceispirillaceae bacterium]